MDARANGDPRRVREDDGVIAHDGPASVAAAIAQPMHPPQQHPTLHRTITDGPRVPVLDRVRKRGRVESASFDQTGIGSAREHAATMLARSGAAGGWHGDVNGDGDDEDGTGSGAHHASPQRGFRYSGWGGLRRGGMLSRCMSLPNLCPQHDNPAIHHIFPDLNPRDLRLDEVRSWYCPWMDREFLVADETEESSNGKAEIRKTPTLVTSIFASPRSLHQPAQYRQPAPPGDELESVIHELSHQLALEDKTPVPPSPPISDAGTPVKPLKRPTLRLKLEDMPTPQQAEDRAQRAANRIIARREAMEHAMVASVSKGDASNNGDGVSATQKAIMRLNFKSYSSGEESEVQSPNEAGRHSAGSAYSPNHGMFTTKSVAVSEAGISSPDSACLHLQENLERVREIGRGASGVVYKAIHIPTLKVVAIKDVPVYGRGQRRQMVRELHALYSNLVPIADSEDSIARGASRQSNAKPRPSPHIVSFYDAFVDRAKNCICLVMEYMSAGSLQDIVLRGGCQNEKVLSRLAAGVLRGLTHIHSKRMVHRDIKPHNLLANRQGEVKISDFGLAKTLNDNASMTKTFVGTLLYMAPERIGGGDYSYPADIWSFGLALVSVAMGKYPLPTQDGFFGLVDSVANEQHLELPPDAFSSECREFVRLCLNIEPDERPSAEELLHHPFITKFSNEETLVEWMRFVDATNLCEDRAVELDSLGEAVYRHIYERSVKFSCQPQSDYGVSFTSQSTPSFPRREIAIEPVQMSLQLGLANYLGVPVHQVYEQFEGKRGFYSDKLLEDYCYSPQSWTASPGIARRQQLFGSDSESPRPPNDRAGAGGSFWKKLQDSLTKFKGKRKKSKEKESEDDRRSLRTAT